MKRLGFHPTRQHYTKLPPYWRASLKTSFFPSVVDLRNICPPVYDQGNLGCCVGNALAGLLETDMIKSGGSHWTPSRLLIYYNAREKEHTIGYDVGASITDAVMDAASRGVCPEALWPYEIQKFRLQPPSATYLAASQHVAYNFFRFDNRDLYNIKAVLTAGYPFIFGFAVYDSFFNPPNGVIPLPKRGENLAGYHAMLVVGFDDYLQMALVRNSWGLNWGQHGYAFMPYSYLTSEALTIWGESWVVTNVPS